MFKYTQNLKVIIRVLKRFLKSRALGFIFIRTKGFTPPKELTLNRKKCELFLPLNGTYAELFRDILLDDEYFLSKLPISKIQNIADVGANLGIFAIAARIQFPTSIIHSYEPNNENLKYLNSNGHSFNFSVYNEAVSLLEGRGCLRRSSSHDTAAHLEVKQNGEIIISNLQKIINRFPNKKIDLLKLDCEGSEFEILKDFKELKRVQYLVMEYHLPAIKSAEQFENLMQLLRDNKFEVLSHFNRNICLGVILAKNVS